MDIEKFLNEVRKDYQKIAPPDYLVESGWFKLRAKLGQPQKTASCFSWVKTPFAFTILILVLVGFLGLTKTIQAALPGDKLYPLKRFSENLVITTTGNKQVQVDNRAQEIIEMAKKQENNDKMIEKTVEEYQKSIVEVKKESTKSAENRKKLHKKLEKREEEFKKISEKNPSLKKHLEKALEITQKEREERAEEDKKDGDD